MPRSQSHVPDALERMLGHLEQEILAAPDRDLLDGGASRGFAAEVRTIVDEALSARRGRRAASRPTSQRQSNRRRPDRRDLVRQLLVASRPARDIAGATPVEALSDSEVDEIMARFAEAGLLPPEAS
jgi:hypothetical protein